MRRMFARLWRWLRTGSPFKPQLSRAAARDALPAATIRDGIPTVQVPPLVRGVRMSFDLADPDSVANFLHEASLIVRAKRRVSITFE